MLCQVYGLNTLSEYKYVVVLSEHNGKIVLSRHKKRTTWETQGGHIEQGETPLEAAKRELFEESGAVDFDIEPLCDYRAWDEDTGNGANGVVFHAIIRKFADIPESEMAEIREFSVLPENLTYPAITPVLSAYLSKGAKLHQMKLKAEPFEKIKNGSKSIELRLNDEKRQKIQVGDFIEFSLIDNPREKLQTRVTALHHFASFPELYATLPKEKLGYKADETLDPNHMDAYYSKEKQEEYGALGIELRLTDF
jgi:8-oxo-dGTP diphosphatase